MTDKAIAQEEPAPPPDFVDAADAVWRDRIAELDGRRAETVGTLAELGRRRGQLMLSRDAGDKKAGRALVTLNHKLDAAQTERRAVDDALAEARRQREASRAEAREADIAARRDLLQPVLEERVKSVAELEEAAAKIVRTLERIEVIDGEVRILARGAGIALSGSAAVERQEWQRRLNRYFGLCLARFDGFANLQFWRGHGATDTGWAARERALHNHLTIEE